MRSVSSMVAGVAGRLAMAAGLVALSAVPARADSFDAWQKQTSDKGCYLYQYLPSVGGMDTDANPDGFVWTGPCIPGQPVNGTGTWYIQTNYPMSDGTVLKRVMSLTGTVLNGLFEGYVTRRTYEVADNGRWDPGAGQIDDFLGEGAEYRAGCEAGQIMEGANAEYGCQPGTQGNAIAIPRVARPYFPLPGAAPAQTVAAPAAPAPSSRLPATYTTVGGVPAAPPAAQGGGKLVSAADIDSVIEYLRGKGGEFNVEETAQGTPGLREASGLFNVFLLGCDANNRQCVTIQFRACSAEYPNASLGKANGWNRQYSYAKAYLDQNGNVCVEQTVPTGRGGISADALDIAFDAFAWLRDNMGRQFN